MEYFDPDIFPSTSFDEWDSGLFSSENDSFCSGVFSSSPNTSYNDSFNDSWMPTYNLDNRHLSETSFESGYTSAQDLSTSCIQIPDFDPFMPLKQEPTDDPIDEVFLSPDKRPTSVYPHSPAYDINKRDISGFGNFETSKSLSRFDKIDSELSKPILCKPLMPSLNLQTPIYRRICGSLSQNNIYPTNTVNGSYISLRKTEVPESPRKRSASPHLIHARGRLAAALDSAKKKSKSPKKKSQQDAIREEMARQARKKMSAKPQTKIATTKKTPVKVTPVVLNNEQNKAYRQYRSIAKKPEATALPANLVAVFKGQRLVLQSKSSKV